MSQMKTQSTNGRKKNTKGHAVEIVFSKPQPGAPEHLLARADLRFTRGLLRGLWLTGFALWNANGANGAFVSVTVPAKEGTERFYDWLRGDLTYLKRVIVKQYAEWNVAEDVDRAA